MISIDKFDPLEVDKYERNYISFRGEDIKRWVFTNLNNKEDFDAAFVANSLFQKYYRNDLYLPHDKQFYYIINSNYRLGFSLRRDLVLSPIIKDNSDLYGLINYNTMQELCDNIECTIYEIRSNSKLNNGDLIELNRINVLCTDRCYTLLKRKFDLCNFEKYSSYKRLQLYSIFRDKLLDLEVLKSNIF